MATQTAKSKLPDVQAPHSRRRAIPNSQPLECLLNADLVGRAIEEKPKPFGSRVKTLTVDNGEEFANHQAIDRTLGIQTYFADPYCSWQRGSNENFSGLLCQYIPKKRGMEAVTDEEWTMIQNKLNHRPRKRLGFKTPHEVFHTSLNRVAVRT